MSSQMCADNIAPKVFVRQVMLPKLATNEMNYYPFTLLIPTIITDDVENNSYVWTLKASKLVDSEVIDIKDITEPVDYPIKLDLVLFESPYKFKAKCFIQLCSCQDSNIDTNEIPFIDMNIGNSVSSITIQPNDLSVHKCCYGGVYHIKITIIVAQIKYQVVQLPKSIEENLSIDPENKYMLNLTLEASSGQVETLKLNLYEWSMKSLFFYVLACKLLKELSDSKNEQFHMEVASRNVGYVDFRQSDFNYTIKGNHVEKFSLFVNEGNIENLTNTELLDAFCLATSLELVYLRENYEKEICQRATSYENIEDLITISFNFQSCELLKLAINLWKNKDGIVRTTKDEWVNKLNADFPDKIELAVYVWTKIKDMQDMINLA